MQQKAICTHSETESRYDVPLFRITSRPPRGSRQIDYSGLVICLSIVSDWATTKTILTDRLLYRQSILCSLCPIKVQPPARPTQQQRDKKKTHQSSPTNDFRSWGRMLSGSPDRHCRGIPEEANSTNFGVLWLRDYLGLAPRQGT